MSETLVIKLHINYNRSYKMKKQGKYYIFDNDDIIDKVNLFYFVIGIVVIAFINLL